jgi:hypothetical protein
VPVMTLMSVRRKLPWWAVEAAQLRSVCRHGGLPDSLRELVAEGGTRMRR